MSKTRNIKTQIVKILTQRFQERGIALDKIVIFGSLAKGMQRRDSDIDVIIVSKDFRKKSLFERVELLTGIGRELVKRTKKPFDIMFYSDQEWNKGYSLVINAAKKEGEVLYA